MPKPKSKVKKITPLAVAMALAILAFPAYAAPIINAQPATSCDATGFCKTTAELAGVLTASQINNLKSANITQFVSKLRNANITDVSYSWSGTALTVTGRISPNTSTYWLLDLGTVKVDPWWNATFALCRNYTVNNTGAAISDYQVRFNITNITGILPDGADIRFANDSCDNGGSELPYWIETAAATYIDGWVKIDSVGSGTAKVMSIYYGNSTPIEAKSNITATMVFGDDFSALNLLNWQTVNATTVTYAVSGGVLNVTATNPTSERDQLFLRNITELSTGYMFEGRTKFDSTTLQRYSGAIINNQLADFTPSSNVVMGGPQYWNGAPDVAFTVDSKSAGSYVKEYNSPGASDTNYHIVGMSRNGTNISFYYERTYADSMTHSNIITNPFVGIRTAHAGTGRVSVYWDWFLVRKFGLPEPTTYFGNDTPRPIYGTNISLFLNGAETNYTGSLALNMTATANTTVSMNLTVNGTIYNTSSSPLYNTSALAAGYYNITASWAGNVTHPAASRTLWANITTPVIVNAPVDTVACFATRPICIDTYTGRVFLEGNPL